MSSNKIFHLIIACLNSCDMEQYTLIMQQEQQSAIRKATEKSAPSPATVRNRRYRKLVELRNQGFFSQDAIKLRHPLLYHNYLGKHSQKNTAVQQPSCTLSQFLQKNLINLEYRERLSRQLEQQMEEQQHKGTEQEPEQSWQLLQECSGEITLGKEQLENPSQKMKSWQIVEEQEIELQQQNLIDHAEQLFMEGKIDKAYINYNEIDNCSDYDQTAEKERDDEEHFFARKEEGQDEEDERINQTYYTGIQDY